MLIVYFYERNASGANITTVGEALWWGVVTVTTVGYGDTYPVTVQGRVVASGIMAIGLLTIAVITAQVSSGYVDQLNRRRREEGVADPRSPIDAPLELRHLDRLHERLDRIEAQLRSQADAERPPVARRGLTRSCGPAQSGQLGVLSGVGREELLLLVPAGELPGDEARTEDDGQRRRRRRPSPGPG